MDTLAETAISVLLGAVTGLLTENVYSILNANDDLKLLQMKLEGLQKVLRDADHKPFLSDDRDKDLEGELKDVLYDAQDIIEEYQTKIVLLSKREKGSTLRCKVHKPWIPLCSCFKKHVCYPYQLDKKIQKINQRLDRMNENKQMVDILNKSKASGKARTRETTRETTHLIEAELPTVREDEKEKLKNLLFDGSTQSSVPREKHAAVSIVSIIGQGGIGKTTLAKMVFKEVEEQFGKRRWWVCVSERPNLKDLVRKILREVLEGRDLGGITSLNELCKELKRGLSEERFLLVLDDIWDLDWWQEDLKATLMGGATGSKILITSRKMDVAERIGAKIHNLPILSSSESWDLFLKVLSKEEMELVSHNLEDIGKRIVNKCGGLPLVVRTVGSLMCTRKMKKEDWEVVQNSEIWEWTMPASSSSYECGGGILPGLILSYDDLPPCLKSCFVYCSIFPKDYEIKKDELVMQWVAHGLVEEKKGNDVEVIAKEYIDALIRRCLIEETEEGNLKLHDILHELASYIGGNEYSHASATKHTRHLSLFDAEVPMHEALEAENKLHTLLIAHHSYSANITRFTDLKWLRVLSLKHCEILELPDSIGHLSLLKYLDLSYSGVTELPASIGRLCNLQTLNLYRSRIKELPKEMGEVCNLRHLRLEDTDELSFIAEGLGKLSNLQTLKRFLVCEDRKNSRGCNMRELEDLNKLKGKLSIEGLGGSRKAIHDAKKAPQLLKEKHGLISLKLVFKIQEGASASEQGSVLEASEQSSVLEALKPPHGLEKLKINDYKGQMPAWFLQPNFAMLQTLKLEMCPLWVKVGKINSLKTLMVIDCPALCEIPSMPALESLMMDDCPALCEIPSMPLLKLLKISRCDGINTIDHMPALESLMMNECGRLEKVADVMTTLKKLILCDLKTLKHIPACIPSLEQLTVENLPSWEGWPAAGLGEATMISMPCLRLADFRNCPKMETQGLIYALSKMAGHDRQTQIQELTVLECPSARLGWKLLKQLPNIIQLRLDRTTLESTLLSPLPSELSISVPSLKRLWLEKNDDLKWGRVPQWVWSLSQLEVLGLNGFIEETSLGGHWQCLQKLRRLGLLDFPKLKSLVDININILQQNDAAVTTSATNSEEQIACLSRLEDLYIRNCPELVLPQELRNRLGEMSFTEQMVGTRNEK